MSSNHIVHVVLSVPQQYAASVIKALVDGLNDEIILNDYGSGCEASAEFTTALASIESFELVDGKKRINVAGKARDGRYGVICDCCQAKQTKQLDQLDDGLQAGNRRMKIVIDLPNEDADRFFNYLDLKYSTEASYLSVRSIQMFNTRGRLIKEAYVRHKERRKVEQGIRDAQILDHLEDAFKRTDKT